MTVHAIDPIKDPRWADFVRNHPAASVFHTPAWLEALRQTYGYEPIVLTTSPSNSPLSDGIAFCRVCDWFSGARLVSLPFSDHCAALTAGAKQTDNLLLSLCETLDFKQWKYMEIRMAGTQLEECGKFDKCKAFLLHKLDLRDTVDNIFDNLHPDCVQRKIQRAAREKLTQHEGRSEELLGQFYDLLLMTRRRHGLPPQPLAWFRNLIACCGDKVRIRIASKHGRPIAGILTLQHNKTLVYKYGCSNQEFKQLGGTQMLLWQAIQDGKAEQLSELDLGRSDLDHSGLIHFKDRWGATRTELVYLRYPRQRFRSLREARQGGISKRVFAHMPDSLLSASGRVLYKYMG